ncbi:cyclic nucleotide-gated cation channel beta-1 [Nematolebias whitei]|uniref:cyclic nucleotide-gated cation channel beta-1 n=1 Tax=Nematolebias whitei TaxID=451745 RepID=UPI00189AEC89|nr:cyclic nucleotide-gated cation channel beta-1 [Nematolebias whitei]
MQTAAGNGPAPGVLTWISSALPQPALPTSTTTKDEAAAASKPDDETGMMAWISQGLEKVVPQLELKSKDVSTAEQLVQVHQTAAPPEFETTAKEVEETEKTSPPSMMDWIKHGIVKVVPQPEIYSKTDGNNKTKVLPPAPPPATQSTTKTESVKDADHQSNMMGWIVSGIGHMLPQPVPKLDAGGDEVQNVSIVQKKLDLVLEDVEEEEAKMKVKGQSKEPQKHSTKKTENARTQVDQLGPVMDNVKKEAEEVIIAQMEARLQQERLEAARVAEEMARKAAEEAVRLLEVEQSAKIIIQTLPESNEPLPNILEEENEDDPECLIDIAPEKDKVVATAQDKAVPSPETGEPMAPPTLFESAERVSPSSKDVAPGSKKKDLGSPVTQQPDPQSTKDPCTITEKPGTAAAAEDSGSGVLIICAPIKSLLLRFPLAADCLESCKKLVHELDLTPPVLSSPTVPPSLAQLTQRVSQLHKQARQHCKNISSRF